MNTKKVITRVPPSPTGHLHIGTVRTALFNYLFAKHHGGEVVFRSEDTDRKRSHKEYEDEIIAGLKWLGITFDNEGDIVRQSERAAIYRNYLEKMLEAGTAYISREPSKDDPEKEVEIVRLKNPNKDITFHDLVRGDITFNTTELGDIVIARSIDDALYHFTVVVDDFEMGVTHILRGEDHISNTPRQILIQEALGFSRPEYAHLPLILAPDRSKMSKRHGTVAVASYQEAGYLPEAIVNYLGILGWSGGGDREIFTIEELINIFDIDGVQKSGAVFNADKFLWYNRQYLNDMSLEDFSNYLQEDERAGRCGIDFSGEEWQRLLPTVKERVNTRGEFYTDLEAGEYDFVTKDALEYNTALLQWKKDDSVAASLPRLKTALEILKTADFSTPETIKEAIWPYAEETGKGEVLWPLRVALSGSERSPDPFTLAFILGQGKTLERIQSACGKIAGNA